VISNSTEAGNRHRIIHYVVIDLDNSSERVIDVNKSSGRVISLNNSSGRVIEVDNSSVQCYRPSVLRLVGGRGGPNDFFAGGGARNLELRHWLGLISRTIKYKNQEVLMKLHKSMVRPHLEYCCAVWSPH